MGERSSQRFVVDLNVPGQVAGRPGELCLYDLSSGGCMIEAAEPIGIDDPVFLNLPGDHPVSGRIVWQHGPHGGVLFDKPLHEAVVRHLGFKPRPTPLDAFRDRFGRRSPEPGPPDFD